MIEDGAAVYCFNDFLAAMLSYDIAKFVRGDRPDWKEGLVTGLVFVGFLAAMQMAFHIV